MTRYWWTMDCCCFTLQRPLRKVKKTLTSSNKVSSIFDQDPEPITFSLNWHVRKVIGAEIDENTNEKSSYFVLLHLFFNNHCSRSDWISLPIVSGQAILGEFGSRSKMDETLWDLVRFFSTFYLSQGPLQRRKTTIHRLPMERHRRFNYSCTLPH